MSRSDTNYSSINLFLNAKFADINTSDSNKTFFLKNPIYSKRPDVKLLLALTEFTLPNSIYNVRTGVNDKFIFTLDNGSPVTITVPEGNYSATRFCSDVSTLLGSGKTLSYNSLTNKITFAIPSASSMSIETGSSNTIGIKNESVAVNTNTLTLPFMCDFSGTNTIFVKTSLGLENRNTKGDLSHTVAHIPVTVGPLGIISLDSKEPTFLAIADKDISKIGIILEDESGAELQLNGLDSWSLQLTVHHEFSKIERPFENDHGVDSKKINETDNK